jgi:hypothetical protein
MGPAPLACGPWFRIAASRPASQLPNAHSASYWVISSLQGKFIKPRQRWGHVATQRAC